MQSQTSAVSVANQTSLGSACSSPERKGVLRNIDPNSPARPHQGKKRRVGSSSSTSQSRPHDASGSQPQYTDIIEWGPILGRGGYGAVQLAMTKDKTLCAIKKIPIKDDGPQRSVIEDAAALLSGDVSENSPYIATMYSHHFNDYEVSNGYSFMCVLQEHLDGKDLFEVISSELVSQREITYVAKNIASALHHLHGLNIVHRDIKPENIMMVKDVSGHDKAVLVDCDGVAKTTGDELVKAGGTPSYVARELWQAFFYNNKKIARSELKSCDMWAYFLTLTLMIEFCNELKENTIRDHLEDLRGNYLLEQDLISDKNNKLLNIKDDNDEEGRFLAAVERPMQAYCKMDGKSEAIEEMLKVAGGIWLNPRPEQRLTAAQCHAALENVSVPSQLSH